MQIRPTTPADHPAVADLVRDAFGDEGDLIVELLAGLRHRGLIRGEFVADIDGAVVGHVGLSHCWIDARKQLVSAQLLSPLSVAEAHRRHGVGTALVAHAIEQSRAAEAPALFLEGDPGYYGSRGFEAVSRHGFQAPSVRIPGPAFQVSLAPTHEDWQVGRVIYPGLWWELDATGLRDPLLAQLETSLNDGGVRGPS